jgi:hypothetical protein
LYSKLIVGGNSFGGALFRIFSLKTSFCSFGMFGLILVC